MAEPENAAQEGRGRRGRRLALGLGTVLAVLGLAVGAVVLVAAADTPTERPGDAAAAVSRAAGAGARSLRAPALSLAATPTPTPGAAGRPMEGAPGEGPAVEVVPGGDEPLGPQETTPVQGSAPENANASRSFLGLRDQLAAEIAAYRDQVGDIEVGIAVTDLQTGQTISVNGNAVQRTACTINMFALLAVVGEFEAGRADPSAVAYNIKVGIGGSFPPQVKQFLETVFGSHEAGVARAREMMRSWGMQASLFDHVPYYGGSEPQNNQLTALETNAVLAKLYRGQLFNPEWTAYTLARLRDIKWGLNYMLPGQLPWSATVAHKIGYYWDWDGWVNNDAGIVTFTGYDGAEKSYAITYLSQKARTEYTGYSFGATLSRVAWDWFDARYGPGASPPPPEPTPEPPPPPPPPPPAPTPTPVPTPTPTPVPTPSPSPRPIPTPFTEAAQTP